MRAEEFKERFFPGLVDRSYLASCSLSARSMVMSQSLTDMLDVMDGNALAWKNFESQVSETRTRLAHLINATPDEIALLPSASVCAYQVASTRNWQVRDRIIYLSEEFPSIAHVWHAQRARGADVTFVDMGRETADWEAALLQRLDEKTHFVSVPLVGYQDGRMFPVEAVIARAREVGALSFVDAYQALGIMPVDVKALGCDFLVGGSMKYLLGLPGLAFLYVRGGLVSDIAPQLTGWFGRGNPYAFRHDHLDFPNRASRYETGTPSVPSVYAANAGLRLLEQLDLVRVQAHVAGLVADTGRRLMGMGESLLNFVAGRRHGGVVALCDEDPARLAVFLEQYRITVSPRGPAVRLSFHYFNLRDDIERFCQALRQYRIKYPKLIVQTTVRQRTN